MKISRWKKNKIIIYSNMGYNKYITKPNKYFYIRGGGLCKKNRDIVK